MDASNVWGAAPPPKETKKKVYFFRKSFGETGGVYLNVISWIKKEFTEMFAHIDTLIIDVTEQRITHPSNEDIQADYYSGKKGWSNTPSPIR